MATLQDILAGLANFTKDSFTQFGNKVDRSNEGISRLFEAVRSKKPLAQEDLSKTLDEALSFSPLGMAAVGKGGTRLFGPALRKGISKLDDAFRVAEKGAVPLTPTEKLLPAIRDIRGNQIAAAQAPGIGQHEILRSSFKPKALTERGFVDPATGSFFSEKALADAENSFLRAIMSGAK